MTAGAAGAVVVLRRRPEPGRMQGCRIRRKSVAIGGCAVVSVSKVVLGDVCGRSCCGVG